MASHYMTKRSCYCGDKTTAIDQPSAKDRQYCSCKTWTECWTEINVVYLL